MALTTAERLKMKAKARGLKTAEERDQESLMTSSLTKGYLLNQSKEALLSSHPDYQLDYLSFLLLDQFPEHLRRFTDFVALNHGSDFETPKVLELMNGASEEVRSTLMTSTGYWVLRHRGDLVCVATMVSGFKLNYLTTMVGHRRQGHATFLLNVLTQFYKPYGLFYGAVDTSILPLFEKCGWKVCSKNNRDETVDACPDYAREGYYRLNSKAFVSRLFDEAKALPLLTANPTTIELIQVF